MRLPRRSKHKCTMSSNLQGMQGKGVRTHIQVSALAHLSDETDGPSCFEIGGGNGFINWIPPFGPRTIAVEQCFVCMCVQYSVGGRVVA